MKNITRVLLLSVLLIYSNTSHSQRDNSDAASVVAGIILGAAAVKLAVNQYKERLELIATNHVLENYPEYEFFELFSMGLKQFEKSFDPSNIRSHIFVLKPIENGERKREDYKVLVMFMSHGWWNEYGVDFSLVSFKLFGKKEWNEIITAYISIASNIEIENNKIFPDIFIDRFSKKYRELHAYYMEGGDLGRIDSDQLPDSIRVRKNVRGEISGLSIKQNEEFVDFSHIKIRRRDITMDRGTDTSYDKSQFRNGKVILYFRPKLTGDTYIVSDYSNEFKIIYNENTLGLFLKSTNELVQYKLSTINDILKTLNLKPNN